MFSKKAAADRLLASASTMVDEDQMHATQSLAAYIEATETGVLEERGRMSDEHIRTVYGEIAAAYQAGYEQGVWPSGSSREISRAIREAGLQV